MSSGGRQAQPKQDKLLSGNEPHVVTANGCLRGIWTARGADTTSAVSQQLNRTLTARLVRATPPTSSHRDTPSRMCVVTTG